MEDWIQEQILNNNLYWLLRNAFFGATIGDILKTCGSGAYIGAFTLSMCEISALAELEWWNRNQKFINEDGTISASGREIPSDERLFTEWIQQWMNKVQSGKAYNASATYAIRCALVHSHGWARRLKGAHIDGYVLSRGQSEYHCISQATQDGKKVHRLNLENLVTDLIFAADGCLQQLQPSASSGFMNYVRSLIAPKTISEYGQVVVDVKKISLDFADSRLSESPLKIAESELLEKIRALCAH